MDDLQNPFSAPRELAPPAGPTVPPADPGADSTLRPWGPWASIGWTLLCLVVLFGVQMIALIVYVDLRVRSGAKLDPVELVSSGNLLALVTVASTPVVIALVAALIVLRRNPVREYLALRAPSWRQFFVSLGPLLVLIIASDLLTYVLGRPIVPPFLESVYESGWMPALVLALIVAAPLNEEVLFRGLLFEGIAFRWGNAAAIAISTIVWAAIHVQYDLYGIAQVAAIGIYLGIVRARTRSLPLTVLLHAITNAIATAEVAVLANR